MPLTETSIQVQEQSPLLPARCSAARKKKTMKCLNPKCERPEKIRGLCWSCYQAARRLVAKKEITWEALQTAGRVKNRKSPHFGTTATINWLLHGRHIDELEYQETGKVTPPNAELSDGPPKT